MTPFGIWVGPDTAPLPVADPATELATDEAEPATPPLPVAMLAIELVAPPLALLLPLALPPVALFTTLAACEESDDTADAGALVRDEAIDSIEDIALDGPLVKVETCDPSEETMEPGAFVTDERADSAEETTPWEEAPRMSTEAIAVSNDCNECMLKVLERNLTKITGGVPRF